MTTPARAHAAAERQIARPIPADVPRRARAAAASVEAYDNDAPPVDLSSPRYVNGRRRRPVAVVADDGAVYDLKRTSAVGYLVQFVLVAVLVFVAWQVIISLLASPAQTQASPAPLGTAAPLPTWAAPASAPDQPSIADYNATQEARAAALEAPALPAPGAPDFAASFEEPACSAMLTYLPGHRCYQEEEAPADTAYVIITATPVATPVATPAPGEPGFAASFEEPTCSAMIAYLRGHPCFGRVNQPPQPQPGSDDFAASFKEPGE